MNKLDARINDFLARKTAQYPELRQDTDTTIRQLAAEAKQDKRKHPILRFTDRPTTYRPMTYAF